MNLTPQTPPHPSGDKRFKLLDLAIKRHHFRQDALIEVLHSAQELFGFLDNDVLVYVGLSLRVPLSRVHSVATFYNFFSMKPPGKHTCVVSMAMSTEARRELQEGMLNRVEAGIRALRSLPVVFDSRLRGDASAGRAAWPRRRAVRQRLQELIVEEGRTPRRAAHRDGPRPDGRGSDRGLRPRSHAENAEE